MDRKKVLIGPLTVSFSDDPLCRNILRVIYGELPPSSSDPDVQITGRDWRQGQRPPTGTVRASEDISVDGEAHYVDHSKSYNSLLRAAADQIGELGYTLKIEGWESDTLSVEVFYDGQLYKKNLSLARTLLKVGDWTFAPYRDGVGKRIVYRILEPLLQAWMIKEERAFLHAASVSVDGRGVALTGWGGSGKTSAASALIQRSKNVRFLSDDLALLTARGELYPYYKSSVIYAYNTAGGALPTSKILEGTGDRLQWKVRKWLFGEKGVRRRIPPEKLFDGQVASQDAYPLETVLYLLREEREQIEHERIPPSELAQRSAAVILGELDWLLEYSTALRSVGPTPIDPQSILRATTRIYQDCFSDVEPLELRIPKEAGPKRLAAYIEREILPDVS